MMCSMAPHGYCDEPRDDCKPDFRPVTRLTDILTEKLVAGPPSLRFLVSKLSSFEDVMEFYRLVEEFLPEKKTEIESLPLNKGVDEFIAVFSDRYFPISETLENSVIDSDLLSELIRGIPVNFVGMESEDYEYFDSMPAAVLLAEAVSEERTWQNRAPVMDEARSIFGDIFAKVPERGWDVDDLIGVLKKSPWPGFLVAVEYIFGATGNSFLDTNYEDFTGQVEWTMEAVKNLARDWPKKDKLLRRMQECTRWLDQAPKKHARQIVDWIADNIAITKPGTRKTLVEVFNE
jgi:hypothetical protein